MSLNPQLKLRLAHIHTKESHTGLTHTHTCKLLHSMGSDSVCINGVAQTKETHDYTKTEKQTFFFAFKVVSTLEPQTKKQWKHWIWMHTFRFIKYSLSCCSTTKQDCWWKSDWILETKRWQTDVSNLETTKQTKLCLHNATITSRKDDSISIVIITFNPNAAHWTRLWTPLATIFPQPLFCWVPFLVSSLPRKLFDFCNNNFIPIKNTHFNKYSHKKLKMLNNELSLLTS